MYRQAVSAFRFNDDDDEAEKKRGRGQANRAIATVFLLRFCLWAGISFFCGPSCTVFPGLKVRDCSLFFLFVCVPWQPIFLTDLFRLVVPTMHGCASREGKVRF